MRGSRMLRTTRLSAAVAILILAGLGYRWTSSKAPTGSPSKVTARPALVTVDLPQGEDHARPKAVETVGSTYRATVTSSGLRFEASGLMLGLRASRIEQGGVSVPCDDAAAPRIVADGVARLDRGCLVEEYVFEH